LVRFFRQGRKKSKGVIGCALLSRSRSRHAAACAALFRHALLSQRAVTSTLSMHASPQDSQAHRKCPGQFDSPGQARESRTRRRAARCCARHPVFPPRLAPPLRRHAAFALRWSSAGLRPPSGGAATQSRRRRCVVRAATRSGPPDSTFTGFAGKVGLVNPLTMHVRARRARVHRQRFCFTCFSSSTNVGRSVE